MWSFKECCNSSIILNKDWKFCPLCGANLFAIKALKSVPERDVNLVHELMYDYWIEGSNKEYWWDRWFENLDIDIIAETWCENSK